MNKVQQEEQYKYFYIDRKFSNGNVHQINEALDDIDIVLPKMTKIDLINSLVIRMLDLIHHAKHFHLKHRVSSIFQHHQHILVQIHSKDQIAAILSKCLKASDQYTRIIAITMIKILPSLFVKDVAVYHTLLSKISANNHFSKKEKQQSIICLISLLIQSKQLAKLFSKNITEIQTLYHIPNRILIYLLTHLSVDHHLQRQILNEIIIIINRSSSKHQKKKEIYYFQRLVIKYSLENYHIVEYYEQKLKEDLPNIAELVNKIKKSRYPFLKDSYLGHGEVISDKLEDFIDVLHEWKGQGNSLEQYQSEIIRLLKQSFRKEGVLKVSILLLFFLERDFETYEKEVLNEIIRSGTNVRLQLLKRALAIGAFEISYELIKQVEIKQQSYILLLAYIDLKMSDSLDGIKELRQLSDMINPDFSMIIQLWQLTYDIFQTKEQTLFSEEMRQTQQQLHQLYIHLHQVYQKAKNNYKFTFASELQVISIILENRKSDSHQIKMKSYHVLPSNVLGVANLWFAYLSKQTILSLF